MGAWGTGPFENDLACDLLGDFLRLPTRKSLLFWRSPRRDLLLAKLKNAAGGGWGDEEAVAAAEIVAAINGKPCSQIRDSDSFTREFAEWLKQADFSVDRVLIRTARAASVRVLRDSGLAQLWNETDDAEQWRLGMNDLIARLDE